MSSSDRYIGKMLDNRYEILELIGSGGMAYVYKARCHRLNRNVALKILKEDLQRDDEFRKRFHTESQAVAMLSHPNIVAIYDVSRSENTDYIVMELIEGITLKQYINRKGLLNWKEALHFSTQITKALAHAHSRGIIHRDVKPHNVMILKDGSVKVADFGIARLISSQNTMTREALGSVHYISPEQAKGAMVDARSDIYSVGVVMYEMLTSRLPFVGESAVSVAIQHISAIPLLPGELNPGIPKGLEDITMHAMEPVLNQRYATAEEMLQDLETFRKNPSTAFAYTRSDPKDSSRAAQPVSQNTRVAGIPRSAPGRQTRQPTGFGAIRKKHAVAAHKPEMNADEYRGVKHRASSTSTLVGVFLIVLFLIAVIAFMWNYLLRDIFSPSARGQIEIDGFTNKVYLQLLEDEQYTELYNFRTPLYEYNDEFSEGEVISQDPEEGTMVDAPLTGNKISIELTVSLGEEPPVLMPDLINRHFGIAVNELNSLDLDLQINEELIESEAEKGYVLETIPSSRQPLQRGDTVTIIYSGGIDSITVQVPDLLERNRVQVESAFESLDIVPKFSYFEDAAPYDTVLFIQYMGQDVTVPRTIEVHLSSGPSETEPPSTEPPVSEPPVSETPASETPASGPPSSEPTGTEQPSVQPPETGTPVSESPPTDASLSPPPASETPVSQPPVSDTSPAAPAETAPPPDVSPASGGGGTDTFTGVIRVY